MLCYASLWSLVSYYVGYFLSLFLFCRRQLQLGVQSVVHLWGRNLRNENEHTNSGIEVMLMNQCKTINKQQNLKLFFYWINYERQLSNNIHGLKFAMEKNDFERLNSSSGKKRNDFVASPIHRSFFLFQNFLKLFFIKFLFIMLFWHWVRIFLFSHLNYQWQTYKKL